MRISDWSSDVCSSDLLKASVSPSWIIVSTSVTGPILELLRINWAWGASDMFSCPPATTMRESPSCTACAASATERSPDPQTWLTVQAARSEEHTSELQSLMRISYAVFCLKKKNL